MAKPWQLFVEVGLMSAAIDRCLEGVGEVLALVCWTSAECRLLVVHVWKMLAKPRCLSVGGRPNVGYCWWMPGGWRWVPGIFWRRSPVGSAIIDVCLGGVVKYPGLSGEGRQGVRLLLMYARGVATNIWDFMAKINSRVSQGEG
jgi:hypothetical protein